MQTFCFSFSLQMETIVEQDKTLKRKKSSEPSKTLLRLFAKKQYENLLFIIENYEYAAFVLALKETERYDEEFDFSFIRNKYYHFFETLPNFWEKYYEKPTGSDILERVEVAIKSYEFITKIKINNAVRFFGNNNEYKKAKKENTCEQNVE